MKYYNYIYFARGVPFYIGKGSGDRSKKHLTRANNPYLRNKIAKLKREGVEIVIEKMALFDNEKEALENEVALIAEYREAGYELCNLTDGGEGTSGYKHTTKQKENSSVSHFEAMNRPEVKVKCSMAAADRWRESANRLKQIATRNSRAFILKYCQSSNYFGVQRNGDYWQARYKHKYLGTFKTEIEAARAYNEVADPDLRNQIDNLPVEVERRRPMESGLNV